jgi:hypothetical protein
MFGCFTALFAVIDTRGSKQVSLIRNIWSSVPRFQAGMLLYDKEK